MTRPTVEHVEPDRAEVDAFDRSCLDLAKGSVRASQRHGSSMRCTRSLARASGPVKDHRLTISHDETTGMPMVLLIADRARVFLKASSVLAAT
jgi:hypothetical protein